MKNSLENIKWPKMGKQTAQAKDGLLINRFLLFEEYKNCTKAETDTT